MTEVIVDNAVVARLANTPAALDVAPFLRQIHYVPAVGGCACHAAQQQAALDTIYNVSKAQLAALSGPSLDAIKKLLNADVLVIYYQDGVGRVQSKRL